jgi:adenine-specific DNA-methyltransferase
MPPRKKAPTRKSLPAPAAAADEAAQSYKHPLADLASRPEVGTQSQFRRKKEPKKYRYDSSLAPELQWDGGNAASRDRAEELLRIVEEATADGSPEAIANARDAARELRRMQRAFLEWTGKAERTSFDVPTLPLFVHERLSTEAIIGTLTKHKRDKQTDLFDLFADPRQPVADQVLRSYEHRERWVNRMILGDSLVVMNSLLQYEGLGGQVQMIYIDPPYGVKFGSNFQPFVRKRDVKASDDADLTREPEMVQAYRDTWELGLHSYLTYLRDRLMVARDLLTPSGSVFVQISDENLHHVREVMDEVFGPENAAGLIAFAKTTSSSTDSLSSTTDYLIWYARDARSVKFNPLYLAKIAGGAGASGYTFVELRDGERRRMSGEEIDGTVALPDGARVVTFDNLTSQRPAGEGDLKEYEWRGRRFTPGKGTFKTDKHGLDRLAEMNRLEAVGNTLRYVRYLDDFGAFPITNLWDDTTVAGFAADKLYVVQTSPKVVARCILMSSEPGDLVLDPTCGGGTTAYVAEHWGRRWITIDTSRVPLALSRQRLLTATFPFYQLLDGSRGPVAGFRYLGAGESSNPKSVGPGILPRITLKSLTRDEHPTPTVLVDRPETDNKVTRVAGPFVVEATIPTPIDWESDGVEDAQTIDPAERGAFVDRMLEVLRRVPKLQLEGNRAVTFEKVRSPAQTMVLHAEAIVTNGAEKAVAFVFGPENGAVSEHLVYAALAEAKPKGYAHLYVIGFAVEPNARKLVESAAAMGLVPCTYVQATPDIMMGDLLKNTRASQIFSVCGLPEIRVERVAKKDKADPEQWQVTLLGLDTFDPVTMDTRHMKGDDVPAWLLDTDYDGLCFNVSQAFFPRGAWDSLKRALKSDFDESVFDHLAGSVSAPFEAGEQRQVAVKVIDDRGNELMVTGKIQ